MEVQARNPQFKVRIVTRRFGEITDAELRGSVVQFSAERNLGQDAGSFRLTLLAKRPPARFGLESWEDVLEAMDYVELWAWVPPREPDRPLMRGFIDTMGETFDISSGTPQHAISISGRDFGKIALITKLYYTKEPEAQSIQILKRWAEGFDRIFQKRGGIGGVMLPEGERVGELAPEASVFLRPTEIINVIFEEFLLPQVNVFTDTFKAFAAALPNPIITLDQQGIDKAIEDKLATFNPMFSKTNIGPLTDVWGLFRSYQHPPWRELFFEEEPFGPVLRYRETPWLDFQGNPIQPFDPALVTTVDISLRDRMEWSLFRSDERVLNFLFTLPANFSAFPMMAETFGPLEGIYATPTFQSNPFLIGFGASEGQESSFQRHGIRQQKFSTQYVDMDSTLPDSKIRAILPDLRQVGAELNIRLKRAMDHGALLEFGSLALKGDERLRIGNYLRFTETGARHYCVGVTHTFKQGTSPGDGRFTTNVAVERGRGYLVRTKQAAG